MADTTPPASQSALEAAERKDAALREKMSGLVRRRDAGELGEADFAREHRAVLEQQAVHELMLKALREVASWEADPEG